MANPSSFHNFDILAHVFSCLDPYNKADRAACVNASRVCRSWSVPASTAIWDARPRWDLVDLYHILFPSPPPLNAAGLVDSAQMKLYLANVGRPAYVLPRSSSAAYDVAQIFHQGKEPCYDPIAWASFLRCCGRTRALYVHRLETAEAQALGLVLKWNEEEILFPALRSLTWIESPRVAGLLPYLAPPSLRQLKLIFNPRRDIRSSEIDQILCRLAETSPDIQKIDIENAHQIGPFPGNSFPRYSSLRRLALGGNMAVTLQQLRGALSLPHLADLTAHLDPNLPADGDPATPNHPVVAANLKKLHSGGECRALTALFDQLEAPSLYELEIFADERRWERYFEGHRVLVQAITGSAYKLRLLRYRTIQDAQSLTDRIRHEFSQDEWDVFVARTPPHDRIRAFWDVLRPLFPNAPPPISHSDGILHRRRTIERLVYDVWSPTEISSEDFSHVQTGFVGFRRFCGRVWPLASLNPDPEERRVVHIIRCTFELEDT
uniref:Non-histone chromosomal protein 6 n=1 Tax=Ganoderma boninense TaxID=34458 RepID=A0A5K1K6Y2_9APHY|nr:Non-histone chromosomal protein 6 [Ganoderma boninense]